jgi:hypothetical protein
VERALEGATRVLGVYQRYHSTLLRVREAMEAFARA